MTRLRDWLAWAAVWTLLVQAPMWIAVAAESVRERADPTLGAEPVAGWVPVLAYVLAVAVPASLLVAVLGAGFVRPRRTGLVSGGLALLVAAVAWSGFPDHEPAEWYVGLSALAGACALVAAGLPRVPAGTADPPPSRRVAVVVGVGLALSGAFLAWTSWRGGSYWQWQGASAQVYRVGLVVGVAEVLLGLAAPWWIGLRVRALGLVAAVVAAALGLTWLAAGVGVLESSAVLYRWEEDERAWVLATPLLLAGVGLLATAWALTRRRGDLAGLSLTAATVVGLLATWQESTWGRVMS